MLKMNQEQSSREFLNVNFRDGIYQGLFNKQHQQMDGFGLIYSTHSHYFVASHWQKDQANHATFAYHDHAHYIYGFWNHGLPHGFNAIRMGSILIMGYYHEGALSTNILVLFQQYNLAVILRPNPTDQGSQFSEVSKKQIYSDQDFDQLIGQCGWDHFQQSWKTLIKFISANLVNDVKKSEQRLKLRLINGTYYRYGFDEGLAIVFDDEYRIISAGVHKKAKLKSLGIRFTKDKIVEQGDFSDNSNIFAFNSNSRPDAKIGKLYSNSLLKGVQFVNRFLNNPAKPITDYFKDLSRSHLFKVIVAGQISNRKLQMSLSSPSRNINDQFGSASKKSSSPDRKSGKIGNMKGFSSNNSDMVMSNIGKKQEQSNGERSRNEIVDQKLRLEMYKKEIAEKISFKTQKENSPKVEEDQQEHIIHKKPVEIASRKRRQSNITPSPYREKGKIRSRSRSRSPIFTPDRQSKSPQKTASPYTVSPFKERIQQKIFKEKPKYNHKNYVYEPIQVETEQKNNNINNLSQYQSPHQALQFSRQNEQRKGAGSKVIPLSIRNEQKGRKQGIQGILKNGKEDSPERKQIGMKKKTISFGPELIDDERVKNRQNQYKIDRPSRNQVYLKANRDKSQQKFKRPKNNSYYQRYQLTKTTSPAKSPEQDYQSKKYNQSIQAFNQSNRPYQIINSPKNVDSLNRRRSQVKKTYQYVFE